MSFSSVFFVPFNSILSMGLSWKGIMFPYVWCNVLKSVRWIKCYLTSSVAYLYRFVRMVAWQDVQDTHHILLGCRTIADATYVSYCFVACYFYLLLLLLLFLCFRNLYFTIECDINCPCLSSLWSFLMSYTHRDWD